MEQNGTQKEIYNRINKVEPIMCASPYGKAEKHQSGNPVLPLSTDR